MQLTIQQLAEILHSNPNPGKWLSPINNTLPSYQIDTLKRVAAFLSQFAHESLDFTHLEENLNYSAAGLLKIFPKYFTPELTDTYARHPEMIANRVYANRMGNGDEASGDGYKFRGRGLAQLTGKDNYHAFSEAIYNDDRLVVNPGSLLIPNYALLSACWFWSAKNLNAYADSGDVKLLTWKINGGNIGLDDRQSRYDAALKVLSA